MHKLKRESFISSMTLPCFWFGSHDKAALYIVQHALHYMHLLSKFKAVKPATLDCLAMLSNHKNAHCMQLHNIQQYYVWQIIEIYMYIHVCKMGAEVTCIP